MASTTCTPTLLCSSMPSRATIYTISASVVLCPKTPSFRLSTSAPQLGLGLFSPWNGLKHFGISIRQKSVKIERKGRFRGMAVYASLFGVGAPEALVIGVVALLVFGPKGLAEVARNLGKTLRAFQPTIRELQDVSREFKSTLEREIGLDEIPPLTQNITNTTTTSSSSADNKNSQALIDPNGTLPKTPEEQPQAYATLPQEDQSERELQPQDGDPPPNKPFNIGEFLVEAQIKSSASQRQGQTPPQEEQYQSESQSQPQAIASEVASEMPPSKKPENDL